MSEIYDGIELNQPGETPPWGAREETAIKAIIDRTKLRGQVGIFPLAQDMPDFLTNKIIPGKNVVIQDSQAIPTPIFIDLTTLFDEQAFAGALSLSPDGLVTLIIFTAATLVGDLQNNALSNAKGGSPVDNDLFALQYYQGSWRVIWLGNQTSSYYTETVGVPSIPKKYAYGRTIYQAKVGTASYVIDMSFSSSTTITDVLNAITAVKMSPVAVGDTFSASRDSQDGFFASFMAMLSPPKPFQPDAHYTVTTTSVSPDGFSFDGPASEDQYASLVCFTGGDPYRFMSFILGTTPNGYSLEIHWNDNGVSIWLDPSPTGAGTNSFQFVVDNQNGEDPVYKLMELHGPI